MAPKTLNVVFAADSSQVGNAFSKIESQSSRFGDKLQSVGKGLTAAVTLPLIGLGAMAVSEASEARVALGQTEAVIKSTGGAANVTAGQITTMADKLGNLAGIEGEVVQESSNLLMTFTKVRNETGKGNDVFNQAQQAILDMGVAMNKGSTEGLDLSAASIQVGKALNDPIQGVTALTRVGVQFTDQQKEQIKTLVESGDVMGAQKVILKELETQFGGSAAAAGKNLPPMERLQLAFANMAESIGTVLLPVVDKVSTFLSDLASKFSGLSPEAQKMVVVLGAIAAAVGPLLLIFSKLITSFGVIKAALLGLSFNPIILGITLLIGALVLLWKNSETFRNIVTAAFQAASSFVIAKMEEIRAWFSSVWPQIQEAITHVLNVIRAAWAVWGDDLLVVARAVWTAIYAVVSGALQIIGGIIKTVLAIINGDWGAAWDGIKQIFQGVWTAIKGIVQGALGIIKGVIGAAWSAITGIFSAAWSRIKATVSAGIDGVMGFIRGIPGRISGALRNLGGLLVGAGRSIMEGLLNGIISAWNRVANYLSGLASKIKNLKGPIEKDRKLLEPEGAAIMDGLLAGIKSRTAALNHLMQQITSQIAVPASEIIHEDDPRWNAQTMGNQTGAQNGRFFLGGRAVSENEYNAWRNSGAPPPVPQIVFAPNIQAGVVAGSNGMKELSDMLQDGFMEHLRANPKLRFQN